MDAQLHNWLKVHHSDQLSSMYSVDALMNSVTVLPNDSDMLINKKLNKKFLFDNVILQDVFPEDVTKELVRNSVEAVQDVVVISVNRGLQARSRQFNESMLQRILAQIFEYQNECEQDPVTDRRLSLRLSSMEIDEEEDEILDLGHEVSHKPSSSMGRSCHKYRPSDLEDGKSYFESIRGAETLKSRFHRVYTLHLYHQAALKSDSAVSRSSTISLLQLDVTRNRSQTNCTSLSGLSRFFQSTVTHGAFHQPGNSVSRFERLLDSIFAGPKKLHFLTHFSGKHKDAQDAFQMLQFSGRMQRLQSRMRPLPSTQRCRLNEASNHRGRLVGRSRTKLSDSELTSASMSGTETVVMATELRGCSDDESHISRHLHSDSDSGCCRVNRSRAPGESSLPRAHWPKAALRHARRALMHGQELWVDGPPPPTQTREYRMETEACDCGPLTATPMESASTPETVVRSLNPLAMHHQQQQMISPPAMSVARDSVGKLSRWIDDVAQLTSSSSPSPVASYTYCEADLALTAGGSGPCYHYYDPGPSPVRQPSPLCQQLPMQLLSSSVPAPLCYTQPAVAEATPPASPSTLPRQAPADKELPKSRSFRGPLDLLRRTLWKSSCQGGKKKAVSPEPQHQLQQPPVPQEMSYLGPTPLWRVGDDEDEHDSSESSSESECDHWFRNVKTFKSVWRDPPPSCSSGGTSAPGNLRPPSAPLPGLGMPPSMSVLQHLHRMPPARYRSNSSGYGSVATHESATSISAERGLSGGSGNALPGVPSQHEISETCERLVRQEKAVLLVKTQELMINEFNQTARPLLSQDPNKYRLSMSVLDEDRVQNDPFYLEELEEETNVVRDSIAFYKSLLHLESSFVAVSTGNGDSARCS